MFIRSNVSTTAKCLDSTQPIYYTKRAVSSDKWVIYLTSGYYCTTLDCAITIVQRPQYTGSSIFPPMVAPVSDSIADPNRKNGLKDWNIAVLVYCSQDFYSGDRAEAVDGLEGEKFYFQGSLILKDWLLELSVVELVNSTEVLLAGSSAGGYGIMYNFQTIISIFELNQVQAEVSVLLDSCFIDLPVDYEVIPVMELFISNYDQSSCSIIYQDQPCCIRADCMIPKFMADVKVFGVNGNYDWVGWGFLPVENFPPRLDYFDNYAIRVSTRIWEATASHALFTPYTTQCHSHQYIKLIDVTAIYCDHMWITQNAKLMSGLGTDATFSWTVDCKNPTKPKFIYKSAGLKFIIDSNNLYDIPFVHNTTIRTALEEWLSNSNDERNWWVDDSCTGLSCNCDINLEFETSVQNKIAFDWFLAIFWVFFFLLAYSTWYLRKKFYWLSNDLLNELTAEDKKLPWQKVKTTKMVISCKQLHLSINNVAILKDVNVVLEGGVFNAVVGRSGSGKSSFVKVIVGHYPTSHGSVWVNNHPVNNIMLKPISSILYQDRENYLQQLTVIENLICSCYTRTRKSGVEIRSKIGQVSNSFCLTRLLHRKTSKLSGGERKLLGLAIELLTDPGIVALDEVTSGLDAAMALQIMRVTKKTIEEQKLICLVVIHQPRKEIWKLFDKILVCHRQSIFYNSRNVIEELLKKYTNPKGFMNIADVLIDMLHQEFDLKSKTVTELSTMNTDPECLTLDRISTYLDNDDLIELGINIPSSRNETLHHARDSSVEIEVDAKVGISKENTASDLNGLVDRNLIKRFGSVSENTLISCSNIESLADPMSSAKLTHPRGTIRESSKWAQRPAPNDGPVDGKETEKTSSQSQTLMSSKLGSMKLFDRVTSKGTTDCNNLTPIEKAPPSLSSLTPPISTNYSNSQLGIQKTTKRRSKFGFPLWNSGPISNDDSNVMPTGVVNAVGFVDEMFPTNTRYRLMTRWSIINPSVNNMFAMRRFREEHYSLRCEKEAVRVYVCWYRHYAISLWRADLVNRELKFFVRFKGFLILCILASVIGIGIFYDTAGKDVEGTVTFIFLGLGVMPFLCFNFVVTNTCIHARLFANEYDRGFNSTVGFFIGQMARTCLDYGIPCLIFNIGAYASLAKLRGWELTWLIQFWGVQVSYAWLLIQIFYCAITLHRGNQALASIVINVVLAVSMALCGYLVPQPRLTVAIKYFSYLIPLYWYMQSSLTLLLKDSNIFCEYEDDASRNPFLCLGSDGNVILQKVYADSHNFAGTIFIFIFVSFLCFYWSHCKYDTESWPRKIWSWSQNGRRVRKSKELDKTEIKNVILNPKSTAILGVRKGEMHVGRVQPTSLMMRSHVLKVTDSASEDADTLVED